MSRKLTNNDLNFGKGVGSISDIFNTKDSMCCERVEKYQSFSMEELKELKELKKLKKDHELKKKIKKQQEKEYKELISLRIWKKRKEEIEEFERKEKEEFERKEKEWKIIHQKEREKWFEDLRIPKHQQSIGREIRHLINVYYHQKHIREQIVERNILREEYNKKRQESLIERNPAIINKMSQEMMDDIRADKRAIEAMKEVKGRILDIMDTK